MDFIVSKHEKKEKDYEHFKYTVCFKVVEFDHGHEKKSAYGQIET